VSEPLSPAAQAVLDAFYKELPPDNRPGGLAATLRAVAAEMIKTDDLTDTAEDIIRGAERHHQAGWLCTMAAELEKVDD
jgi:hypothetical protein